MYATRENVAAAIQALQARGEKVTTRSVRQEIGGGSLEDIGQLIAQVLMGEPAAISPEVLPAIPYDLPEPDQEIIQRHLAQLEGEAQALALMNHLQELVNSARAVQAVGGGIDWLFRRVQAMGEVTNLGMSIRNLHDDLRQVSESAAHMLTRMRREYRRVKAHDHEEAIHG
jgi:hypothetical protein